MRVNLRGFDAGMPERILNVRYSRTRLQQVHRIAMAEHVWRDISRDANAFISKAPLERGGGDCKQYEAKLNLHISKTVNVVGFSHGA